MTGTDVNVRPFFIEGQTGRIFCIYYAPVSEGTTGGPSRAVMVLPAFAEEMNKTRRMLSLLGRQLSSRGIGLLIPDLYGTGDSEGHFGSARLIHWQKDLASCTAWLRGLGVQKLDILAVRAGALLLPGLSWADETLRAGKLLLWMPVLNGRRWVSQFLRLKLTAEMVSVQSGDKRKSLRQQLCDDGVLEVAGYELSNELAAGLELIDLSPGPPVEAFENVHWFEVVGDAAGGSTPATDRAVEAWRAVGAEVRVQCVPGPPFWGTAEIATIPALLDYTVESLAEEGRPGE